jgi:hypothetical protein
MLIVEFDVVAPITSRNAVEVIYVAVDEKPAELEQRLASLVRRPR